MTFLIGSLIAGTIVLIFDFLVRRKIKNLTKPKYLKKPKATPTTIYSEEEISACHMTLKEINHKFYSAN